MSRTVSATIKKAMFAETAGAECPIILLEINHPTLSQPIFVCHNSQSVISNGNNYLPFPFQINLPNDTDESLPQVQLVIDNVDRSIVSALRSITTYPTVTLSVVLFSNPNNIEVGPFNFSCRDAVYDKQQVTATLTYDDILNEPFPGYTMTPASFPGLYDTV